MFWKKCGKEIKETWKVCPNCGEPITDVPTKHLENIRKNEKQNKVKKPIFKRVWFWIVIILVVFLIFFIIIGESEETPQNEMVESEIQTDLSDLDMEDFFGQSGTQLEEQGLEKSGEISEYTALDGAVYVSCTSGIVDIIMLDGMNENMPSFHGIKTGMNLSEAESILADIYSTTGQIDNQLSYMDMDTGINIVLETEGEEVISITAMQLSQEEISSYMQEGYIFPDSDKKYLTEDDVRSVEADMLALGRNEIFARHGYIFEDDTYKQYFESKPWYKGTIPSDQFNSDEVFNDFEKKNVELIKKVEDEINNIHEEFIGLEGTYICIDPLEDGITGRFDITNITDNTLTFSLGTLEGMPGVMMEQAQIIDEYTAQITTYGFTITFTWSDPENMYVTNSGEITGMEAAVINDVTESRSYTRPTEFN